MSETTTVKVRVATRERLRAEGETADQVINEALDALDERKARARMWEQSHRVARNAVDRAEIASVRDDMSYLAGGLE